MDESGERELRSPNVATRQSTHSSSTSSSSLSRDITPRFAYPLVADSRMRLLSITAAHFLLNPCLSSGIFDFRIFFFLLVLG